MKEKNITRIYNKQYAKGYDEYWRVSEFDKQRTDIEIEIISNLINDDTVWLDLACGTGYLLSKFPNIERAGLDISRAMLEAAKKANPSVPFYLRNFLEENPEWTSKWSLITCTWQAYIYCSTMDEITTLIKNIANWTKDGGKCFWMLVPLNWLMGLNQDTNIDYKINKDPYHVGQVYVEGVVWSYRDDHFDQEHSHLVAPHPEYAKKIFERYFSKVSIIPYSKFKKETPIIDIALIAEK